MNTPNSWEARNRSREASNDYYQKTPLVGPSNGYNMGSMAEPSDVIDQQGQDAPGLMKPVGIKVENSQNGVLTESNPAYQEPKQK